MFLFSENEILKNRSIKKENMMVFKNDIKESMT